jgi:phospholipase/carboxylesterase
MQSFEQTLGPLHSVVVDTVRKDQPAELAVVLCHGFGAPGTDLVGLATEFCRLAPGLVGRTRFVFPAAPLALDELGMPGARAWWHLDLDALNQAIEQGAFRDQRLTTPDGLEQAREQLGELVTDIQDQWQLDPEQLVLGGFSQGSMIATDVALRMPEAPSALCIWSGTLLCQDTWQELAQQRGALRVFQSHGRSDPLLPFAAAQWLRDLLVESGLDVDFLEFSGEHTIPMAAVEKVAVLLDETLAS